jgi:hypothetical protein
MRLLKDRTFIVLLGASLVLILLMVISFITAVSVDGYCISPSPIISTDYNYTLVGQNITVYGQNFTPNGTAVLYGLPEGYTSNVDKNGNTFWSFTPNMTTTFAIYALDGNSTNRRSNTITLIALPVVSDMPTPPSPAFPMDVTFIALISTGALLLIGGQLKKK